MKDISIISNSLIVNELLKLVFKKREEKIDFIKESDIERVSNSLVIIDDSIADLDRAIHNLKLQNNRIILLGENSIETDYRIEKPFLPKDIENILEEIKKNSKKIQTNILDPDEIAHIKALMALDDEEKGLTPFEKLKERESFQAKGKEAKELLFSLAELHPKELKKLLKKSKVSIKISFKESNNA